MPKYIVKRGDWYHFNKRVPEVLKHLERRTHVSVSLKTKCPDTASRRAAIVNDYVEAYWSDIIENGPTDKDAKLKRALRLAELHGFRYRPAAVIAGEDLPEIVARVEATPRDSPEQIEAILGNAGEPQLILSQALELYWEYARHRTLGKSHEQIRIWRNPRKRSVGNFIEINGDKAVQRIQRSDLLNLRDWWLDRIENEGISPNTVNKEVVQFLREILTTINDNYEPPLNLDIDALFKNLRIEGADETRPPFSSAFIQNVLLNQTKLAGMDEDGRLLLCALADTGARPREIITRQPDDIILDTSIPHIKIRPKVEKLGARKKTTEKGKTSPSTRDIPLVGASLYAFQKRPNGFQRYAQNVNSFTSRVNKFLRENDLLETPDHSLYSFRHSFQDRLTALEVGHRMECELMGHAFRGEKYGDGPTLEHKQRVLQKSAFIVVS